MHLTQSSMFLSFDSGAFSKRQDQKQASNSGNPTGVIQSWVEDTDISKLTNRFTSSTIQYDAAGNVTRDEKFSNLKFLYDANNRQRQSSNLDDSNAVTAIYDGAGQRVATKVNGSLSINIYDAFGKLIAEYGPATPSAGSRQYIFSDQQGTPRVVTNQSGSVLSRHDYQPFGEELAGTIGMRAGTPGYSGGDGVKQKYAGMEGDDTGLSHTLWRQYDTKSGRWTGPDPYSGSMTIGDPQSFNRYTYVNNDPVNQTDALGLMSEASQSWGDVAGSFWPAGFDFGVRPSAGLGIIGAAEGRYDEAMQTESDARLTRHYLKHHNYSAANAIFKRNSDIGLNVDGKELWGKDAGNLVSQVEEEEKGGRKVLSVKINVIDNAKGFKGEVAEGGLFEVKVKYQCTVGPNDAAGQILELTGIIESGADFVERSEVPDKGNDNPKAEIFIYTATLLYRAKNVVPGDGSGSASGTISFKAYIVERRRGSERRYTPSDRDPTFPQKLRPRLFYVSVRDTIRGTINPPGGVN